MRRSGHPATAAAHLLRTDAAARRAPRWSAEGWRPGAPLAVRAPFDRAGRPRRARNTLAAVAAFDEAVDGWFDRRRGPIADAVGFGLSSAADHSLLWLAAGAVRAAREGTPRPALVLGAALGIESFTTNLVVKSLFRRVRPPRTHLGPLPYGMHVPITSSFPSGHATAAFTAATFLGHGRRSAPAWYALAMLVAASRVYVRMHHASDVVAGAALGVVLGAVLRRVLAPEPPTEPGADAG